ncbi:signal transduction histidine kinase [Rubrivivax gelatinosus]|uniref:HAMP domain-containing sensor histidine kinase n=2 Tax=Rubrivivax gelatinosus TaxID=28068 RepID=UPI0018CAD5E3|nr:histidine kinase [Rubrivivax gelatinosus]MBG6082208.1 signal transduction histidine kinase [Rubrivivax gelatinosus]
MNLLPQLVVRLVVITVACLFAAIAWIVVDTHRSVEHEAELSAQRVGRHLEALYWQELLWRGRARAGLNIPVSDWQSFETLNLISPGVCVSFALHGEPERTLCSQTAALGPQAPAWFVAGYGALFRHDSSARRPLFARAPAAGYIVDTPDRGAAIRQAWQQVSLVAGIAAGMAAAIALLTALMIGRTLRPARAIVAGLRRLEDGELAWRLPAFRTGEFALIAGAVNQLAGRLAHTHEERNLLTTRLLQVQENERRALARDLHDEFGQCLTATAALAASIEAGAPADRPDIAEEAQAIGRAQARMMKTLRSALVRLRTQDIEEIGLEASLRQLISEHNLLTASRSVFQLQVHGAIAALPRPIAIDVYRIAQECLNNAARHGAPTQVALRVARDGEAVAITVEDDGGGDAARIGRIGGHGIPGLRERLSALGGTLAIANGSAGIRVAAVIPLPANDAALHRAAA